MVGFLMLAISFWSGSQDADHSWFHPPLLCGDVCCPSKMWIFGNFDSCMNPSEIKNPLKSSKNLRFDDAGKKPIELCKPGAFSPFTPQKKHKGRWFYIRYIYIYQYVYKYINHGQQQHRYSWKTHNCFGGHWYHFITLTWGKKHLSKLESFSNLESQG